MRREMGSLSAIREEFPKAKFEKEIVWVYILLVRSVFAQSIISLMLSPVKTLF